MFIITDRAVFAPYEDHSNEFRNEYYTEVDLTTLVISEDITMRPAYYQVFRDRKVARVKKMPLAKFKYLLDLFGGTPYITFKK